MDQAGIRVGSDPGDQVTYGLRLPMGVSYHLRYRHPNR
jgi:hypothetical protein